MDIPKSYYNNLQFFKTSNKLTNHYDVFVAKIKSDLNGTEDLHIIFVCLSQFSNKNSDYGKNLNPVNIQTRKLPKNAYPDIPPQNWKPNKNHSEFYGSIGGPLFIISKRESDKSIYKMSNQRPELPQNLKLELLHNPKKKTKYQFNNKITLLSALETYQCSIEIDKSFQHQMHNSIGHTNFSSGTTFVDDFGDTNSMYLNPENFEVKNYSLV